MTKLDARLAFWAALMLSIALILVGGRLLLSTSPAPPSPRVGALLARTSTPVPIPLVPGNLLTNPSFELPYSQQQYSEINVAHGWTAWYFDIPPCKPWKPDCFIPCPSNCQDQGVCLRDYGCFWARPEFVPVSYFAYPYRVHSGETAQKYFSYGRMHQGGLYQQVTGIAPGAMLEFSAWAQAWMCFEYNNCADGRVSDQPSDMHLRIGIDPTGGTVPTSTTVIWSAEAHAFDQWTPFSVQAKAVSNTVTVFTHSRPEWDYARRNNDVYLDDASLVVLGPPADLLSVEPPQPELGQLTTIRLTLSLSDPQAALTIVDPHSLPITPTIAGVETWQFTPTVSGTHMLTLSTSVYSASITSSVRAIAAAHLIALPSAPPPGQTVTVYASAYYPYANAALAVMDPEGATLTPVYGGQTGDSPFVWTWTFTPVVTGTYACTFSADMLDTPVRRLVFAGGHDVYLPIVVKR